MYPAWLGSLRQAEELLTGDIALFGGGAAPALSDVIDYATITVTSSATDFGNLSAADSNIAGASSSTRALFGGVSAGSAISFVTVASKGNSSNFGNLTVARVRLAGASNATRALFAGGNYAGDEKNVIGYVTIANTSSANDFGDLTVARYGLAGASNSHGGLS